MDTAMILIVVFCGVLLLVGLGMLAHNALRDPATHWIIKAAVIFTCLVGAIAYLALLDKITSWPTTHNKHTGG